MRALKRCHLPYRQTQLAVTTQAHEGIETYRSTFLEYTEQVTTQAHEGIETPR